MTEQPLLIVQRSAVGHILLTLVTTFLFTYFCHYHTPALLRSLTRSSPQPPADPVLSSQLATLRRQSNTLNTPATFAQWSKVQRQLQQLEKQQQQQQQQSVSTHSTSPLLIYAVVYASLAGVVGLLWWAGWSMLLMEVVGSEWLRWSPARLMLGEIGVVRWSLVCYRVISLLIARPNPATHVSAE